MNEVSLLPVRRSDSWILGAVEATAVEESEWLRLDLWKASCPNPAQLEKAAQDHIWGWRFHSHSRQPDPVLKLQRKSQAVGNLQGAAQFLNAMFDLD